MLWLACLACPGFAQLAPDRVYFGLEQGLTVSVERPEGVEGALRVDLFEGPGSPATDSMPVVEGRINLSSLFPLIWDRESPRLLYAQLFAGDSPVGPPLVLDPMLTPNRARLVDESSLRPTEDTTSGRVMFDDERRRRIAQTTRRAVPAPERVFSGLRVYRLPRVVFETSAGVIEFRLRPDAAPNTVFRFMQLVRDGFYDGGVVHRVVAARQDGAPFIIQFGDPTGTGLGGSGEWFDLEPSSLPHGYGTLSMARFDDPNAAGGQIFIALSRRGTAALDGLYTAFAEATRGATTIRAIANTPTDTGERPLEPPTVFSAKLVDAPPLGRGEPPLPESESDDLAPSTARSGGARAR